MDGVGEQRVCADGSSEADNGGLTCCCLLAVRRYAESNGMGFEKSNPQK
jgi:hypothetical protein